MVARILLAILVLTAFLSNAFPFTTLASGQICNLACCAGRAPHAAGSCMDGSCHAAISTRSKAQRRRQIISQPAERFCGLSTARSPLKPSTVIVAKKSGQRSHTEAWLESAGLKKPCESDCGTCSSSGFSSRTRERTVAALSHASKPRPPSAAGRFGANYSLTPQRAGLCNRSIPRGPPLSFS
jgi:hypothetical protein